MISLTPYVNGNVSAVGSGLIFHESHIMYFFPSAILSLFTTSFCRLHGSPTGLTWSNSVWSAPHVYVNRGLSIALDFKDNTKTQHKPERVKTFLGWDISGRWKMAKYFRFTNAKTLPARKPQWVCEDLLVINPIYNQ